MAKSKKKKATIKANAEQFESGQVRASHGDSLRVLVHARPSFHHPGKSDKLAAVEAPLQVRYAPYSEYRWKLETQTMIFRQGWDLTRDLGTGNGDWHSMLHHQHQQSADKEPSGSSAPSCTDGPIEAKS